MKVYSINDIELSIFHKTDIVLNETIIRLNGEDIRSQSQYGFRKDELLAVIGDSNKGTLYTTRGEIPELKINDNFRKSVSSSITFAIDINYPIVKSIESLRYLGFDPIFERDCDKNIHIKSNDYIRKGNDLYKIEYFIVKKDDTPRFLKINVTGVFNNEELKKQITKLVIELTELKKKLK